jgi:hypothetical protein
VVVPMRSLQIPQHLHRQMDQLKQEPQWVVVVTAKQLARVVVIHANK